MAMVMLAGPFSAMYAWAIEPRRGDDVPAEAFGVQGPPFAERGVVRFLSKLRKAFQWALRKSMSAPRDDYLL
jgi:hypothetical protein